MKKYTRGKEKLHRFIKMYQYVQTIILALLRRVSNEKSFTRMGIIDTSCILFHRKSSRTQIIDYNAPPRL